MLDEVLASFWILTVLFCSVLLGFGVTVLTLHACDCRCYDAQGKYIPSPLSSSNLLQLLHYYSYWRSTFTGSSPYHRSSGRNNSRTRRQPLKESISDSVRFHQVVAKAKLSHRLSMVLRDELLIGLGDGDIVACNSLMGHHTVVVAHPDMVKAVLSGHHLKFPKLRTQVGRLKFFLGEGLYSAAGNKWQEHRHMIHQGLNQTTTSSSELNIRMISVFNQHSQRLVKYWLTNIKRLMRVQPDAVAIRVNVKNDIQNLTMGIMCASGFSCDLQTNTDRELLSSAFEAVCAEAEERAVDPPIRPLWVTGLLLQPLLQLLGDWWHVVNPLRAGRTRAAMAYLKPLLEDAIDQRLLKYTQSLHTGPTAEQQRLRQRQQQKEREVSAAAAKADAAFRKREQDRQTTALQSQLLADKKKDRGDIIPLNSKKHNSRGHRGREDSEIAKKVEVRPVGAEEKKRKKLKRKKEGWVNASSNVTVNEHVEETANQVEEQKEEQKEEREEEAAGDWDEVSLSEEPVGEEEEQDEDQQTGFGRSSDTSNNSSISSQPSDNDNEEEEEKKRKENQSTSRGTKHAAAVTAATSPPRTMITVAVGLYLYDSVRSLLGHTGSSTTPSSSADGGSGSDSDSGEHDSDSDSDTDTDTGSSIGDGKEEGEEEEEEEEEEGGGGGGGGGGAVEGEDLSVSDRSSNSGIGHQIHPSQPSSPTPTPPSSPPATLSPSPSPSSSSSSSATTTRTATATATATSSASLAFTSASTSATPAAPQDLLDMLLRCGEGRHTATGAATGAASAATAGAATAAAAATAGSKLSRTELRDHLSTLLLKSHESTSACLMWTIYELACHPEVQSRCQHEVDRVLKANTANTTTTTTTHINDESSGQQEYDANVTPNKHPVRRNDKDGGNNAESSHTFTPINDIDHAHGHVDSPSMTPRSTDINDNNNGRSNHRRNGAAGGAMERRRSRTQMLMKQRSVAVPSNKRNIAGAGADSGGGEGGQRRQRGGYLGYEDMNQLTYLLQVLKECMRLHPTTGTIQRYCQEDCQVGPYVLRAGTTVLVSTLGVHKHASFWDRPNDFLPERFSHESIRETIKHPYQYVPFSAGPRGCVGQRAAVMEMLVVLGTLLSHFSFSLAAKDRNPGGSGPSTGRKVGSDKRAGAIPEEEHFVIRPETLHVLVSLRQNYIL